MSGEAHLVAAAEAVGEIIGDRLAFALVVWVPGKEGQDGSVAYIANGDLGVANCVALTAASRLMLTEVSERGHG